MKPVFVWSCLLAVAASAAGCASIKSADPAPNGAQQTGGASGTGAMRGVGAGGTAGIAAVTSTGGQVRGTIGSPTDPSGCVNLQCQQPICPGGAKTTVTGTVYDPAGKVPLYNVIVYVPNAPLAPITEGVTCDKCNGTATGSPVASALSDANGHFVLENVPAGTNIPLVVQVGKWRREVTLRNVAACAETVADAGLTRLPRNRSEGHLPRIAVTTGHSDALECLLRKLGLSDSEFTTAAGGGRVNLFVGGASASDGGGANSFVSNLNAGAAFPAATTLWASPENMKAYDMILLSCEGSQYGSVKEPYISNVKTYADSGGRLFADHLHSYWLRKGAAPWPQTATYVESGKDLPQPFTVKLDDSFPKGMALADWLVNVGASKTRGTLEIYQGQYTVQAVHPGVSQRWIYTDANPNDPAMRPGVEYMTFNVPVEETAENQCGRVVFTDLHVVSAAGSSADVSHPDKPFPSGCTDAPLSPQEKALEFMLFDLSSCVLPDMTRPTPPPIE